MEKTPFHRALQEQFKIARTLFLLVACGALILWITLPEYFHTCELNPYKRHENPDSLNTALVNQEAREGLFFHCVYGLHLVMLITTSILYNKFWWAVVVADMTCLVLYFPGLFFVERLKRWSGDTACRPAHEWPMKSNGVSGHYYYISYQILLTYFLACLYFGGGRNHYRFLPVMLCLCVLMVNGVTTWTYGYHSLRQIFLGALIGIAYSTVTVFCAGLIGNRCIRWIHARQKS